MDRTKETPLRMTPQQAAPTIFHAMFSQVSSGDHGHFHADHLRVYPVLADSGAPYVGTGGEIA